MSRQQVPNNELSADTARANLLTNGGFEIWQRGVGPFSTSATYTTDRWWTHFSGGPTMSVSRDTLNTDYSLACAAVTVAGNPSAANSTYLYQYAISSYDNGMAYQLRGKMITFSVRARSSVANGIRLGLAANTSAVETWGAYHSGSGVYETLTVSMLCPTNMGGFGMSVDIAFTANGTYYVDNAMLVIGTAAANYAPLHPADDLARCQRYYEIIGATTSVPQMFGYGSAGMQASYSYPFKVTKAASPTVTKNGTWSALNCNQPAGVANTGGITLYTNVTATGVFNFDCASASTYFSIEANP